MHLKHIWPISGDSASKEKISAVFIPFIISKNLKLKKKKQCKGSKRLQSTEEHGRQKHPIPSFPQTACVSVPRGDYYAARILPDLPMHVYTYLHIHTYICLGVHLFHKKELFCLLFATNAINTSWIGLLL